jgi:hypothetical protein
LVGVLTRSIIAGWALVRAESEAGLP